MITRVQYDEARTTLRENGTHGLRWLRPEVREAMQLLMDMKSLKDVLAQRADIVAYCQRIGTHCTPWHTADLDLLARFQARKRA